MPGRDDALAQINSARTIPTTVDPSGAQTSTTDPSGAQTGTSTPKSTHKSLLGVNLDKLKTLDSITFQSGLDVAGGQMGGEMFNSIAYIQYWKRSLTADSVQTSNPVVQNAESYNCLGANSIVPVAGTTPTLNPTPAIDTGSNLTIVGPVPSTATGSNPQLPQTTPALPPAANPAIPATPTAPTILSPTTPLTPCPKVNGAVVSANPNGGFNGFIRRFLGFYSGQIPYSGVLSSEGHSSYGVVQASAPTDPLLPGKWQFLFNPEEIDWEGGPDYGEAETWGVMGDDNAGKPLSWKYMKNQKLTFSKVLLNGYVFGKRVDTIEQGLKDLFMKDDGDNPNGPPVLEFIWGENVRFGPCVLRDLRIKQKNWDNGHLVNAEVSFTLERVPKWVVNDGYVDVARPSSDFFVPELFNPPPASTQAPGDGEGDGATQQPPAGTTPAGAPSYTPTQKCNYLKGALSDPLFSWKYTVLQNRPNSADSNIGSTLQDVTIRYLDSIKNYKARYYSFWDKYMAYKSSEPYRQELSSSVSALCKKGNAQFDFSQVESLLYRRLFLNTVDPNMMSELRTLSVRSFADNYYQKIDPCVSEIRKKIQSSYNSLNCVSVLTNSSTTKVNPSTTQTTQTLSD